MNRQSQGTIVMTMRLVLAAAVAAGLMAPAAFAEPARKPAMTRADTQKAGNVHSKADRRRAQSGKVKNTEAPAAWPYSTQKDEMTR
jgi:hypothetical protein